jgi:hypothetical protein
MPSSIPEPMNSWPTRLPAICSKWPWRIVGVKKRHIWYSFLIFLTSDQPHDMPLVSGAKKSELERPYTLQVIMKTIISMIEMITMNCPILILAQQNRPSDWKIFSSRASDSSPFVLWP